MLFRKISLGPFCHTKNSLFTYTILETSSSTEAANHMRIDKSMSFVPYANKSPFKYFTTKVEITTQLTPTNHSTTLPTNHVRFPETETNRTLNILSKKVSSSVSDIVEEKYHKLNITKFRKYENQTNNSTKTNLSL